MSHAVEWRLGPINALAMAMLAGEAQPGKVYPAAGTNDS